MIHFFFSLTTLYFLTSLLAILGALALGIHLAKKLYKQCPSNKALIIYSKFIGKEYINCYHSTSKFIFPFFQHAEYIDLSPHVISIPLKTCSLENIHVNLCVTATIAIDTTPSNLKNVAHRLAGLDAKNISIIGTEIITSYLRLKLSEKPFKEIYNEKYNLIDSFKSNIDHELKNIGLTLLTLTLIDFKDDHGYSENISQQTILEITQQAKNNLINAQEIAESKIAESKAKLYKQTAHIEIEAYALEQEKRINLYRISNQREKAELLLKKEMLILENELNFIRAQSDAALKKESAQIEAIALQLNLEAKAAGYKKLIEACHNDAQAASTLLLIEKLENIAKWQAEGLKNINIDQIALPEAPSKDSNKSEENNNSGHSQGENLLIALTKLAPAVKDLASNIGIKIPQIPQTVVNCLCSEKKETINHTEPLKK